MITNAMLFNNFQSYFESDVFLDIPESETILIVTGKTSFQSSGAASIIERYVEKKRCVFFNDFSVNPKIEDAVCGAAFAVYNNVKHVIAIGGGSVMDMAKLIIAIYDRQDQAEAIVTGDTPVKDNKILLTCIPTTAGSGSESTHFAVAYIGSKKYSVASTHLYATSIVLEPELTSSNTAYQRTVNGLDALSQAIESAWAMGSTPESRENSFAAIYKTVNWLPIVSKTTNADALRNMLSGANLAGRAIDVSKTTSAHAFSYGFTSLHGVPHGHAVWLTLPAIFETHLMCKDKEITDPRGVTYYRENITRIIYALGMEPINIRHQLVEFLRLLSIEPDMRKIGADSITKRRKLVSTVNLERIKNNPVDLNERTVSQIFHI